MEAVKEAALVDVDNIRRGIWKIYTETPVIEAEKKEKKFKKKQI